MSPLRWRCASAPEIVGLDSPVRAASWLRLRAVRASSSKTARWFISRRYEAVPGRLVPTARPWSAATEAPGRPATSGPGRVGGAAPSRAGRAAPSRTPGGAQHRAAARLRDRERRGHPDRLAPAADRDGEHSLPLPVRVVHVHPDLEARAGYQAVNRTGNVSAYSHRLRVGPPTRASLAAGATIADGGPPDPGPGIGRRTAPRAGSTMVQRPVPRPRLAPATALDAQQ